VALELTSRPPTAAVLNNLPPEARLKRLWPRSFERVVQDLEVLCVFVGKLLATVVFTEEYLRQPVNVRAYVRYVETLEATLSSPELSGTFRANFFKRLPPNSPFLAEKNLEFLELLDPDVFADTSLFPADGSRDDMVQRGARVKLLVKQHGAGHSGCTLIAENRGAETELQYPQPPYTYALDSKQYKKPCQQLLNHVLNLAYQQRLKMSADGVYRLKGHRYCEYVMPFKEFVWQCVGGQAQNPEAFGWATTGEPTINSVAYSMSSLVDELRLQPIKWSRHHFSYANGVLNADGVVFYWDVPSVDKTRYCNVRPLSELDPTIFCPGRFEQDYPVEHHLRNSDPDFPFATPPLQVGPNEGEPGELTYLRHLPAGDPQLEAFLNNETFDQLQHDPALDNYFDPLAIPTPAWDTIMDAQQWNGPTKFCFRFMLGRTIFNIGQKDGWQLILVLWGVPGVGKSVIIDKWRRIYDERHVGTMMSDVEQTFSDGHLMDKYIQMLPDLVKNKPNQPALSTHRWKSYATGESVTSFRKNRDPVTKKWNANTVVATNDVPPWSDIAFMRRLFILLMEHPVARGDSTLDKQCEAELPLFLISCVRAYDLASRLFGSYSNLLSAGFLPDHVLRGTREYAKHICPLQSFILSEYVVFGEEYSITVSALNRYIQEYIKKKCSREIQQLHRNFAYSAVAHNAIINQNPGLAVISEGQKIVRIGGMRVSENVNDL
jgi:hypothetical protein